MPRVHVNITKHLLQILFICVVLAISLEIWCSSSQEQSPIRMFISFSFHKILIKTLTFKISFDLFKTYFPVLKCGINRWIYYRSTTNPASTSIITSKSLIDLSSLIQV
jgi:hypothetical protein